MGLVGALVALMMVVRALAVNRRWFLVVVEVGGEIGAVAFRVVIFAIFIEFIKGWHLRRWRCEGCLGPLVDAGATAEHQHKAHAAGSHGRL